MKKDELTKEKINYLQTKAKELRRSVVRMISQAKSGHPGGSLSAADIMSALYFHVLRHDPKNPKWPERDRFHLSKGHACPILYAVLAECGYFPKEELLKLRCLGAMLQGHPDRRTPGVEFASGSLGQGLSVAMGMALAGRLDKKDYRVYVLMGDGEIQEGNIWEAAMAAAHFKCSNLCAILDYNGFQIDGKVSDVMGIEPIEAKWQAFGWLTVTIDGHNMQEILKALERSKEKRDKPFIIISKTIKGKGVSFMEHVADFHGRSPNEQETNTALQELE